MALAQIPISTFSYIWVFVCQYGIMFVIIVIIIIIIIVSFVGNIIGRQLTGDFLVYGWGEAFMLLALILGTVAW